MSTNEAMPFVPYSTRIKTFFDKWPGGKVGDIWSRKYPHYYALPARSPSKRQLLLWLSLRARSGVTGKLHLHVCMCVFFALLHVSQESGINVNVQTANYSFGLVQPAAGTRI